MSIESAIQLAREHDVKYVDIMFGDMFGTLQHFTVPATRLDAELFEEGLAFDGSSVRGWKSIDKSDMNIKPVPDTAFIDPFREQSTICFFGDIYEPRTGQRYDRDPRSIAHKALGYLSASGIGDMASSAQSRILRL